MLERDYIPLVQTYVDPCSLQATTVRGGALHGAQSGLPRPETPRTPSSALSPLQGHIQPYQPSGKPQMTPFKRSSVCFTAGLLVRGGGEEGGGEREKGRETRRHAPAWLTRAFHRRQEAQGAG